MIRIVLGFAVCAGGCMPVWAQQDAALAQEVSVEMIEFLGIYDTFGELMLPPEATGEVAEGSVRQPRSGSSSDSKGSTGGNGSYGN